MFLFPKGEEITPLISKQWRVVGTDVQVNKNKLLSLTGKSNSFQHANKHFTSLKVDNTIVLCMQLTILVNTANKKLKRKFLTRIFL